MLIFTNRAMTNDSNEKAFGRGFMQGADQLGMATVEGDDATGWTISAATTKVTDKNASAALEKLFTGGFPVLVYIHGNNNTPAKCFNRCKTLEKLYGKPVIGFSWPSEGYASDGSVITGVNASEDDGDEEELNGVTAAGKKQGKGKILSKINRYHQATKNGKDSGEALARFLRLLAAARLRANQQPFTLAAHSLGAQFLEYTLDLSGASESASSAQNIILLAPCVRSSGHKTWLGKMRPKGQLFVTFNHGDSVLAAASIADNGTGPKLGLDPTDDLFNAPYMRYITCTNAAPGIGGHAYFADKKMSKAMEKVFSRIFGSQRDMTPPEYDRQVYGVQGSDNGLIKTFN